MRSEEGELCREIKLVQWGCVAQSPEKLPEAARYATVWRPPPRSMLPLTMRLGGLSRRLTQEVAQRVAQLRDAAFLLPGCIPGSGERKNTRVCVKGADEQTPSTQLHPGLGHTTHSTEKRLCRLISDPFQIMAVGGHPCQNKMGNAEEKKLKEFQAKVQTNSKDTRKCQVGKSGIPIS